MVAEESNSSGDVLPSGAEYWKAPASCVRFDFNVLTGNPPDARRRRAKQSRGRRARGETHARHALGMLYRNPDKLNIRIVLTRLARTRQGTEDQLHFSMYI